MRQRLAWFALLASSLVVGCGSNSDRQVSAVSLAEAMSAAGSVRFDLYRDDVAPLDMTGAFDFERRNGVWKTLGSEPDERMSGRWSAGRVYLDRLSLGDDVGGGSLEPDDPCSNRRWVLFDIPDASPRPNSFPTPFDPSDILTELAGLDVELGEGAADTLSGTPVRRFEIRDGAQRLWPGELLGEEPIDRVQLWVDEEGRLRRIKWIGRDGGARVEYSDFGVAVEPEQISDDETCSFSSWFGYTLKDF